MVLPWNRQDKFLNDASILSPGFDLLNYPFLESFGLEGLMLNEPHSCSINSTICKYVT